MKSRLVWWVRSSCRFAPWLAMSIAAPCIAALAHGCDDGRLGPRSESCQTFCDKLELCDDRTDVAGCIAHCSNQAVRSDEYLAARASCAQQRSCNTFANEIGVMGEDRCGTDEGCTLNDCTSDSLSQRKLTSLDTTYCARLTSKLKACDARVESPLLEGHCVEIVPTLSDEYLDLVEGCIDGDCSQVRACLRRAADRFNTELTPAPGNWLSSQDEG